MKEPNPLLFTHCSTEQEREDFAHQLASAEPVLRRLMALLEGTLASARPGKPDYQNAAWGYQMADWLGYERAVKKVGEFLIHLDQKETSDNE